MARDLRLTDAKDFDKVANANLSVGYEVQQAKACWIGQRTEEHIERRVVFGFSHRPSIQHIRLDIYEAAAYPMTHMDMHI